MERAVLIGIITRGEISHDSSKDYLEELAFLTKTAGADPIKTFTQKLNHPDHKTFLGKGKIQEINLYVKQNGVDLIVFDDDLSASQIRNLEKIFDKSKVLDRSNLILTFLHQELKPLKLVLKLSRRLNTNIYYLD